MTRRFLIISLAVSLSIVLLLGGMLPRAAGSVSIERPAALRQSADNAYCVGDDLHVDLTIGGGSDPRNLYRVAGNGPNLPSSSATGDSNHTFAISGPGDWSDLHFEYSNPDLCRDASGWCRSGLYTVSPTAITCGSTEPPPTEVTETPTEVTETPTEETETPEPPPTEETETPEPGNDRPPVTPVVVATPKPGCDVTVYMPSTAVNGLFLDNAPVYWSPGNLASPLVIIEAGKTYRVDGLDASGVYRKVLISCTWAWVQADKVGPDPSAPWYGKPLPNHVTS
jgi:hypothetical protein